MLLKNFRLIRPEKMTTIGSPAPMWTLVASSGTSQDIWRREVPRDVAKLLTFLPESEIDSAALLEQIELAEHRAALMRITERISRSDRSTFEMSAKLESEGYRSTVVEAAIARAVSLGILDDQRYLELFIRSRRDRGWGNRKIAQSLTFEGFNREDVDASLALQEDDETERAYAHIAGKSLPNKDPKGKLVSRLVRKGFSTEAAYDAVRLRMEEDE